MCAVLRDMTACMPTINNMIVTAREVSQLDFIYRLEASGHIQVPKEPKLYRFFSKYMYMFCTVPWSSILNTQSKRIYHMHDMN